MLVSPTDLHTDKGHGTKGHPQQGSRTNGHKSDICLCCVLRCTPKKRGHNGCTVEQSGPVFIGPFSKLTKSFMQLSKAWGNKLIGIRHFLWLVAQILIRARPENLAPSAEPYHFSNLAGASVHYALILWPVARGSSLRVALCPLVFCPGFIVPCRLSVVSLSSVTCRSITKLITFASHTAKNEDFRQILQTRTSFISYCIVLCSFGNVLNACSFLYTVII